MEALVSEHLLDGIKVSVIKEAGHENCSRKRVTVRWPPIGACLAYNEHLECKHQVIIITFFFCFTAFYHAEISP